MEGSAQCPKAKVWTSIPRASPSHLGTEASGSALKHTARRWKSGCWGQANVCLFLHVSAKLLKTLSSPSRKSICSFHIEEELFHE